MEGVSFLIDFVFLLLVLFATAITLNGWGRISLHLLGLTASTTSGTLTVWFGFAVILASLEIFHLFMPVDWRLTAFIFSVGVAGECNQVRKRFKDFVDKARRNLQQNPLIYVSCIGLAFYFCLRAMQLPIMYDSGLYHFASIRWLNEEPIVPGLGNLHWRLALNQSYFGFLALLNIAPYWNKGYAAGGLFLLLLTSASVWEFGLNSRSVWRTVVVIILSLYLCQIAGSISNPSPDIAISLLEIVVFLFLLELLDEKLDNEEESRVRKVATVLLLSFSIVTIKLSGLAFAAVCVIVTLSYEVCMCRKLPFRIIKVLFLIILLTGVHLGRGVLLSGAPLFPSTFAGAWFLPWAMPVAIVEYESDLIYAWARQPGVESLANLSSLSTWFIAWSARLPFFWKGQLFLASLLTIVNFYCLYAFGSRQFNRGRYLIYIPIFVAYAFWFLTAPDIRFLSAINIIYLGLSTAIFIEIGIKKFPSLMSVIATIKEGLFQSYIHIFYVSLLLVLTVRWVSIQPISLVGWPELPEAKTHVVQTDFGLVVLKPDAGEQCWNAPIPCASVIYGSLRKVPWTLHFYIGKLTNSRYSLILK